MRSEASSLRSQAEALVSLSRQLRGRVDGIEFEGHAATRFRQAVADETRQVDQAAAELGDLADYILRAAVRVEAEIAERRQVLTMGHEDHVS